MGLLDGLAKVLDGVRGELDAGASPGDAIGSGAQRAARELAKAAVESDEVRAGASGFVLGVTLGETARRLKRGDIDGALDAAAQGAGTARATWKARPAK